MAFSLAYKRIWKITGAGYVYVDSWGGDDLLGDGSADRPYQTINKAILKSGTYVLKGYFSEMVNVSNKIFVSDFIGDTIFDGKGIYYMNTARLGDVGVGLVVVNVPTTAPVFNYVQNSIIVNGVGDNYGCTGSNMVWDNVKGLFNLLYNTKNISYKNIDLLLYRGQCSIGATNNIYDNCKITLDAATSNSMAFINCLFRVNCTFWVRKSDNSGDIRIDADGQTATQKYAAITSWINSGVVVANWSKISWINSKITDNRIFNKPDSDTDGYNFDYSLIYGDKENYPACYMDNGKHIGPFPPALKIVFKATADLTSSPFEIEVKPTDKVVITGERLSLASDFVGCVLLSKPMPVPMGANFNSINLSVIPDTENKGVFVTPFDDAIDFSDASKISPTALGVPLSAGVSYYVKAGSAYVTYAGNNYQSGSVITAIDSTTLCYKSAGDTATLHPIYRPTIWNGTKMKIAESRDCPSDFLTNDAAYPWIDCKSSHSSGANTDDKIGMRCLRVGNMITGTIDVGTDGKPLTSAHPEFYSVANTSRTKFMLNVRWVILRLSITKYN
jgi:hypothetical protein